MRAVALALCPIGLWACGCADNAAAPPAAPDPSSPVQLTRTGGDHPTVSGDGAWIAFELPTPHHYFIGRISPDGSQQVTLTDFCSREPDWSPAGHLIVFRCGEVLYTVDATTLETASLLPTDFDSHPAWSPSGGEIAVKGSEGIVVFSYPDGVRADVLCARAGGGGCAGTAPAWSPDGQWIAFGDVAQILKVPRSGGSAEVVVQGLGDVGDPAWSRDARWIAFTRLIVAGPTPRGEIWVADARGSQLGLQQVTRDADDHDPCWSPDGRTLYFASDRSGRAEVWKVAFTPEAGVAATGPGRFP
jgi:Tol biopolymer transport system component